MTASRLSPNFQLTPKSAGPTEELYYWSDRVAPSDASTVGAAGSQELKYWGKESIHTGSENSLRSPLQYFNNKDEGSNDGKDSEPLYYHLLPGAAAGSSRANQRASCADYITPPVTMRRNVFDCAYKVGDLSSVSKDVPKNTPTLFEFSELPDLRTPYQSNQLLASGVTLISPEGIGPNTNETLQKHLESSTTQSALPETLSTGSASMPPDEGVTSPKVPSKPAGRARGGEASMTQQQHTPIRAAQLQSTVLSSSGNEKSPEKLTYGLPVQTFPLLSPCTSIQATAPPSSVSPRTAESCCPKGGVLDVRGPSFLAKEKTTARASKPDSPFTGNSCSYVPQGGYNSRLPSSPFSEKWRSSKGGATKTDWQQRVHETSPPEQLAHYTAAANGQRRPPGLDGQNRMELAGFHVAGAKPGDVIAKPPVAPPYESKAVPSTPPAISCVNSSGTTVYRCRSPPSPFGRFRSAGIAPTPTILGGAQRTHLAHGVYPTVTSGYVTYPHQQDSNNPVEREGMVVACRSGEGEPVPKQEQYHPSSLPVQAQAQTSSRHAAMLLSPPRASEGDSNHNSNPSCQPAQPQPATYYYEVGQVRAPLLASHVSAGMHYCLPVTEGEVSEGVEGVRVYPADTGEALSATTAPPPPQQHQQETAALSVAPAPHPRAPSAPVAAVGSSLYDVPAAYEIIDPYTGTPQGPRYTDADAIYYLPGGQVPHPPNLLCVNGNSGGDLFHVPPLSQYVLPSQPNLVYQGDYQYVDMVPAPHPPTATTLVVDERSEPQQHADPQPALLVQQHHQGFALPSSANSFYEGSQELFPGPQELFTSSASSRESNGDIHQRKAAGCRRYSRRPTGRKLRSARVWCCSAE
ncbi:hypothetical protein CSUI_001459 [Cystoisospora suis]|uniref:Uncharacterized protein n=1 Tax=Cystoisospora suis TaxID=483139 RepID=A0A2C6LAF1_9APIC|nr:hypothetical protein CSUI_001459 [Cystoisospora suis]